MKCCRRGGGQWEQDGEPGSSKEGSVCLGSQVSSGKAGILGDGKSELKCYLFNVLPQKKL